MPSLLVHMVQLSRGWSNQKELHHPPKKTPTHTTFGDNYGLSRFDPFSGGAGEQALENQAAAETPWVELGAEVTRSPPSTLSTQDNHDPGKVDLFSRGAGGQVEQAAAKQVRPSLPAPHLYTNEVLEDQAAVEAPLLKDLLKSGVEVTQSPLNASATQDNATATGIKVAAKPSLPSPYLSINTVWGDQAPVEAPLMELGAEATWLSSNTFSTQDNHDLNKLVLISG